MDQPLLQEIRELIAKQPAAINARCKAREYQAYGREHWQTPEVGPTFMLEVLRAKFLQHKELQQHLLSTGQSRIIFDDNTDAFWGIGDGTGENHIGLLLMQIRSELRQKSCTIKNDEICSVC